ncbi:MAG: hypothetical protein JO255_18665 [Alphaproteobacteria bacterium]|nr:hypothetical protein [Alphaproteobacteria bacterium]
MLRTAGLRTATLMVAAPLLLAVPPACAQTSQPSNSSDQAATPSVVVANKTSATADVIAVDHDKRTVTLRGSDGKEFSMNVPDTVRNLDQVQPGDQLTVTYDVATAVYLEKTDPGSGSSDDTSASEGSSSPGGPSAATYETVEVAPKGEKPAGIRTRVIQVKATVENVDYDKRQVTLRGPQGNEKTIDVGDNVPNFDQIKKGDTVLVRHTEAVAATVTK